jgi:hypothetical protein
LFPDNLLGQIYGMGKVGKASGSELSSERVMRYWK